MSLTRIWMPNWQKTCNYLPMTVMESTIVTARVDYRKARSWPSLYAIISARTETSRSTISTVSVGYSDRSFLTPFPTTVLWNSCRAFSSRWWCSWNSMPLANARGFRLSTVQWFPYATTLDVTSTRCSKDWQRAAKVPWAGVTVSSYTCCATTVERW